MALKKPYRSNVQDPSLNYLIALNTGGNLRKLQNVVLIKSLVTEAAKPAAADDRWLVRVEDTELVDPSLLGQDIRGTLVVYDKEILGPTIDSPITKKALAAAEKKAARK